MSVRDFFYTMVSKTGSICLPQASKDRVLREFENDGYHVQFTDTGGIVEINEWLTDLFDYESWVFFYVKNESPSRTYYVFDDEEAAMLFALRWS